jgi:transposase-like protein
MMDLPPATSITVAPRCPRCESGNTIARRSQRITGGLEFEGEQCGAQKQYRECRQCGKTFAVIKIGSPLLNVGKRRRGWIPGNSGSFQ